MDDPDSRVHIVDTATEDLKGLARMAWSFWRGRGVVDLGDLGRDPTPVGTGGELVTFAAVGALSTLVTLVLFVLLRGTIGSLAANALALTLAAVANTAANRRWTFGHRGAGGRAQEWRRAAGVHVTGLTISTGALLLARAVDGGSLATELLLLTAAFAVSTALRFLLMPAWIFRSRAARR